MLSKNRSNSVVFLAVLLVMLGFSGSSAIAASCEGLASLSLPNTRITSAERVILEKLGGGSSGRPQLIRWELVRGV